MGRFRIRVSRRFAVLAGCALLVACGDTTPISFNHPVGDGGDGSGSSASFCHGTTGTVTKNGGSIDCLSFAIVGDTRPATINDTSGYPTGVASQIWSDLQAQRPRPEFAVTTGDYIFASPSGSEGPKQLDLYLQAQSAFTPIVFHAMGNHECTGYTTSNCASASASSNANYQAFLSKMVAPLGETHPYFARTISARDGRWTAKLVFVAANSWDQAQADWLEQVMSQPTTYTFVVRHEPSSANTAPGVTPSDEILKHHPWTLLLVGHTHTYEWLSSKREVIVGIGGAPLTGSIDYGYVLARQRTDGAIQFSVHDWQTQETVARFAVNAAGHGVGTIPDDPPASSTPTPSATPTPTPTELVTNGTFDTSLSGWTLGGAKDPIDSSAHPHSGSHALRCGATSGNGQPEPDGDSFAYQTVTIPASASSATLSFWYYRKSADPQNDWQEALVRDGSGATLKTLFHGGDDGGVWTHETVSLSSYAGRSVQLWFNAHGDGGTTPTTLWIDDVSLLVE